MGNIFGSTEEESKETSPSSQTGSISLTKEKDPWTDVQSPIKIDNGFLSEADRQRMESGNKIQQREIVVPTPPPPMPTPPLKPSFPLSPSEKQSISDKVPFSNLNTPIKYIGSIIDDEPFQRTSLPPTMATPVSTPIKQSVNTPAPSFVPPTPACSMCSALQREIETLRCSSAIADADKLLAIESAKNSLKSRVIDLEKELSESKKRLADKDYQLQLSASVATERDTLMTRNRVLQEQLSEVETELRKTSSNDLALEATLHHLEDTLTASKNELEFHKQAHEVTKHTLELTRAAKLDSDRIIIEQNLQHQKDTAEISDLKYKLASLQSSTIPDVGAAKTVVDKRVAELESALSKAEGINAANAIKNAELTEAHRKASADLQAHLDTCIPNKFASERTITELTATKTATDKRIAELQQQLADVGKNKDPVVATVVPVDQSAVLATKDSRIADLEKQLTDVIKDKNALGEQLVGLNQQVVELTASSKAAMTTIAGMSVAKATADKKISELEKQLLDATKGKDNSTYQSAALITKDNRIAELELQIKNNDNDTVAVTELRKRQMSDMMAESLLKDKMLADKDKIIAEKDKLIADASLQTKKDLDEATESAAELRQHLLISMKELADAKQALVDARLASAKEKEEREGMNKQLSELMAAKINADKEASLTNESLKQTNATLTKALADIKLVEANAEKIKETNAVQSNKDRTEIDRLNRLLNEAESQIKNDIDAISTLQKQLGDAKTATATAEATAMAATTAAAAEAKAKATVVPMTPAPVLAPVTTAADKAEKDKLQQRVALLEGQVRADLDTFATLKSELAAVEAAKAAQAASDATTIQELHTQLDDITRRKSSLDKQAALDHDSIAKLRLQIQELLNKQNQQSTSGVDTVLDAKRVRDLQDVNTTLLALSKDVAFQQDLQRPFVKVALDCWAGNAGAYTDAQMEGARFDEGVVRIYPRLKAFEQVCDSYGILFPIDHIVTAKTSLSKQAVTDAFGPAFVATHSI